MDGTSIIELSRTAVENNLGFIQEQMDGSRVSSVVKANAYGHGIEQFVPLAESSGINHFSVFSADEARRVYRVSATKTDIQVMGWMQDHDLRWAIDHEVEFFVFTIERVRKAIQYAEILKKPAKIHIEVETGMNRTGYSRKEVNRLIKIIKENRQHVFVVGICTHLAGAESIANHLRIVRQLNKFQRICDHFKKEGIIPLYRHTACSAAAFSYPRTRMDMVRIGIMQYGFWSSREVFIQFITKNKDKNDPLQQVIKWKSWLMTIKEVKTGEFVSYGTSFLAQEDMRVGVVPVGYSVGYSRSLSNQGRVLVNGHRAGVIGLVNMNMLIVDISHLDDVKTGDEVVLIGQQDENRITVASFSEFNNQLNYALLTRLPTDIKRIVVN
jgi:alanine racemase